MKKIVSILICLVMLLFVASCSSNKYIGIDKAKQTVVDDIGAAIEDVEFAVNDLITDANGDYYKIHFTKDGKEYIYKVDAMTGKIINRSSNTDNADDSTMQSTSNTDNLLNNNDVLDDNTDNMMNSTSTTSM